MAIDNQGFGDNKKIVITCDSVGCVNYFEGEPGVDWQETWTDAKRSGWSTRQIAGEWLHGCKTCGKPT